MMSIKKINNLTNLSLIYGMYEKAKILLSFHNSGQWQNKEPSLETIAKDIDRENLYGLFRNHQLVGACALLNDDKSYNTLLKGNWLNKEFYKVMHRFVIDAAFHRLGYGSIFIQFIENLVEKEAIYNIRVDTHVLNIPMTKLLIKNQYVECGEVFIEGAGPRIIYHKELRNQHGTSIRK